MEFIVYRCRHVAILPVRTGTVFSYNQFSYFLLAMLFYVGAIILSSLAITRARVFQPVHDGLQLGGRSGQYLSSEGAIQRGDDKPWGDRTCSSDPNDVPNTGNTSSTAPKRNYN